MKSESQSNAKNAPPVLTTPAPVNPPAQGADEKKEAVTAVLPNKPGEPEFKLELSPDVVIFKCAPDGKAVYCDVKVKNTFKEKHTFKVKCTSAEIFRVQPPVGIAKGEDITSIRIWFQNKQVPASGEKHYFAIFHMKCPDGKSPKDMWTKTAKPEGVRRLAAVFEKAENKP